MPDFKGATGLGRIYGRNEFLRSTHLLLTESYTFAASVFQANADGQKILQPGTLLAKITSGVETGKTGAFDLTALDGRQTPVNIVGLNLTYVPWQLLERDVEISACYSASARQDWCNTYGGTPGVYTPLTNLTVDSLVDVKGLALIFK